MLLMVEQFLDGLCIVYICIYIFSKMRQTVTIFKRWWGYTSLSSGTHYLSDYPILPTHQ